MTNFFENKRIKIALLIISIILILNGVLAMVFESLSLGVILTFAFGAYMLLCGLCPNAKFLVILKTFILVVFLLLMAYSGFVYVYGGNDNVTYEEDAVIVLGTVVIGDQPSTDLKNRLDATIDYYNQNPKSLIIVTGGQGTDENDSEASVMHRYLVSAGLPEDKIIMEDRATSTVENFKHSKDILKSKGFENPEIAYISNDFHLFRAGILAKNAGFNRSTHYHGITPLHMIIPNGLRESVITIKMWLID